jgi:hypothetical protein
LAAGTVERVDRATGERTDLRLSSLLAGAREALDA